MSSNKFFTIMVVPEKSQQVRKIVIPSAVFKGGILSIAFMGVLAGIMVLDYANVMNQINENKKLKVENRELRQSVQVFKTKMVTMENTLDRVKTFVTKLRIITNIEEPGGPAPHALPQASPASLSSPPTPQQPPQEDSAKKNPDPRRSSLDTDSDTVTSRAGSSDLFSTEVGDSPGNGLAETSRHDGAGADSFARAKRQTLLAALMNEPTEGFTLTDADNSAFVKSEFTALDSAYDEVNKFALATEQETQSILERLGEKRTLLASTPTRIPTLGYITSEYGVRISPYDSRRKMHEGIDIANRYGADIVATADGEVIFSGTKPGYGKIVIIDHGNGIETRYAHSSKLLVSVGDRVKRGQIIAAVGNTGHSTGPHCHYEVHANGLPVDPCWYVLDQPALCRSR